MERPFDELLEQLPERGEHDPPPGSGRQLVGRLHGVERRSPVVHDSCLLLKVETAPTDLCRFFHITNRPVIVELAAVLDFLRRPHHAKPGPS